MQKTIAEKRQDKDFEIGYSENVGGVPAGWRELSESNSRSLDEMMRLAGRPLDIQVRELPK